MLTVNTSKKSIQRHARAGLFLGLLFATILLTAVGLWLFFTGTLAIMAASTPVLLPVLAVAAGMLILVSGLVGYRRNKIRASQWLIFSEPVQVSSLTVSGPPEQVAKSTANMLPQDDKSQFAAPTVLDAASEPGPESDEEDSEEHTQDGKRQSAASTVLDTESESGPESDDEDARQQVAKSAAPTTIACSSEPATLAGHRVLQVEPPLQSRAPVAQTAQKAEPALPTTEDSVVQATRLPEKQVLVMPKAIPGEKPTFIKSETAADGASEEEHFFEPEAFPTDLKADGLRVEDGEKGHQQARTTTDDPAAGWASTFSRLRANLPSATQVWERVPSLGNIGHGALKAGLFMLFPAAYVTNSEAYKRLPVAPAGNDAEQTEGADEAAKKGQRPRLDSVD